MYLNRSRALSYRLISIKNVSMELAMTDRIAVSRVVTRSRRGIKLLCILLNTRRNERTGRACPDRPCYLIYLRGVLFFGVCSSAFEFLQ